MDVWGGLRSAYLAAPAFSCSHHRKRRKHTFNSIQFNFIDMASLTVKAGWM